LDKSIDNQAGDLRWNSTGNVVRGFVTGVKGIIKGDF